MLRVRLVGRLALEYDGRELGLPRSRRGRALLAWLALHPGDHARGSVAARFWPDVLDESARASLRAALTELRGALGPAVGLLTSTRETVGLAGSDHDLWVDVRAFDALIEAGRPAQAVEIGNGELLTGMDDEWVLEARSDHNRRLGDALETLATTAEGAGDLAAAVRHSRSAAALDPLDEEVGRRLIARLALSGENANALEAYESLAGRLRSALAVAPSPRTRALVEEIRRAAHAGLDLGSVPLPAMLERRYESPFIGRGAQLQRLRAAWAGVQLHGARRLVLIAGEPGVGKTRLALEFARQVGGRDALVLFGRCWDEPLGSYEPMLSALRHVEEALGAGALESLAGATAGDLARILGGSVDAAPEEDLGARHRLFDAIDAAISGLARQRPLLLVLDDLHWADRPTLLLLAFLMRSPRSGPLLLLGTYRDTELGRHSPLADALADLQRDGVVDRIAVRGLERAESGKLVERWLGPETGRPVAAELHERTAGNAFFLEEVLRGFDEEGRGVLPEGIRQAVGARLARLSDAANDLLAAAAVAASECPAEVLAGAAGLSTGEAEDALDEVLRARLLSVSVEKPHAFEFPHSLVREVIYDELNALRRGRLHRTLADQLIARDEERHLEEIAQHLFEATGLDDQGRAVVYLTRAGHRSVAMLGYEAAVGYFERALQVVGPDVELLIAKGDALSRAGDRNPARASSDAAAALARSSGDARGLAEAALGYAGLSVTIVAVDERAVALLAEALAAVGEADVALRSRLLARLAVELYYAPSRDRSEALSAEAVAVAQAGTDQRSLAAALGARHVALWRPDRLLERLETAEAMIAAAQAAADGQLELQGRNWRAVDLFELGDVDGWREEASRHAELSERLRMPAYIWYGPLWQAVDAMQQGRFAEAEAFREQARELGTRAGDENAELFAGILLGPAAHALLRRAFDEVDLHWADDKIAHSPAGVSWIPGYSWVLAELGRKQEAREYLARIAPDRFATLPFDTNWLGAIGEASEAVVILGDTATAAVLYDLLKPYTGRPITAGRAVVNYGSADRHLGELASMLGRAADATRHFEAALTLNARTPAWLPHTQLAFARHLKACGEYERAAGLADEGARAAAALGITNTARWEEPL
jgi:DNA-binding SARP family transcriptional activator/DNA polymerase III delta prime subunit